MTFALIVLIVLCATSAALYCQSDVRRLSPEDDVPASTTRALGCVEARPVPDLRHGAGTGKDLFASTGLNRTEQQDAQEGGRRSGTGVGVHRAFLASPLGVSLRLDSPGGDFASSVPAASGDDDVVGGALLRTPPTTTKLVGGAAHRETAGLIGTTAPTAADEVTSPPTPRQLHPSSYSERWWAEFANQPPLVPRRHLTVVEHENRLARAASEFTERDQANPRGIRRPIETED